MHHVSDRPSPFRRDDRFDGPEADPRQAETRRAAEERAALRLETLTLLAGAHGGEGPLTDRLDLLARRDAAILRGDAPRPLRRLLRAVLRALTQRRSNRHSGRSAFAGAEDAGADRQDHPSGAVHA